MTTHTLAELTAELTAAYVRHNAIPLGALPDLIASVHGALAGLERPVEIVAPALKPAVPIGNSVADDHIVCLENGKRFKSLKRHLAVEHGMTPEQYRAKWGLPASYPMVAPAYAAKRSALSRAMGLGRKAAGEVV